MWDLVHPLDYRYGSSEIRAVLSLKNFFIKMALVELAVVRAQEELGIIPKGVSQALERAIDELDYDEIKREEEKIKHDVMALVKVLARHMGDLGEYLHIGLTSADLRDTAKILVVREALAIIKKKLNRVLDRLVELADRYKALPCVARTHGVHANLYTLGRKFAVLAYELYRSRLRIDDLEGRLYVGKISGAVGIHTGLGKIGIVVEEKALNMLRLRRDISATQVLGRDIFAELFSVLAIISSSLDRLATEIRNLHRTEISEVKEGFSKMQVGSSAMPHKQNPITAENISSLAKILRGLIVPALENIVLWHERDLTNSAAERFLIAEFFGILDEQLTKTLKLLEGLRIYPEKIRNNLEMTQGMIYSEILTTKLALAGMGRQKAHEYLRQLSMKSYETGIPFRELVKSDETIRKYLGKELDEVFIPEKHLEVAVSLTERIIKEIRDYLRNAR